MQHSEALVMMYFNGFASNGSPVEHGVVVLLAHDHAAGALPPRVRHNDGLIWTLQPHQQSLNGLILLLRHSKCWGPNGPNKFILSLRCSSPTR